VSLYFSVASAFGLIALSAIGGCDSSDSTPAQKFEKPAEYKDSDTPRTPDDIFKKQRQDRGTDGTLKAGKAKLR